MGGKQIRINIVVATFANMRITKRISLTVHGYDTEK